MAGIRRTATAVVTLQLRIAVRSSWGEDCELAQVYRQAEHEAVGHIRNAFQQDFASGVVSIEGKPKVSAVITTRETT